MLGGIEFMHTGVMPPFAGTDAERAALAVYLNAVQSVSTADAEAAGDGETIFEQNCSMCHPASAIGPLFKAQARDANALSGAFKDLTKLSVIMPDLKLPERQRVALAQWVNTQRSVNGSGNAAIQHDSELGPEPVARALLGFQIAAAGDVLPPHCRDEFRAGRRRPGTCVEVAFQESRGRRTHLS
jgi:mono/diheme cytochrome c family protein